MSGKFFAFFKICEDFSHTLRIMNVKVIKMDAFTEIIDTYRDNLIFFLNRTLQNLSIAEELAADTFAELIIHPGRYDSKKAGFKTWLFTIAHHKMVDYIRHANRYKILSYEETPDKSLEYESFEKDILNKERNRILHDALFQIKEDYRTALHLIFFEDMSYEEAAKVMKKNRKQIDNLVYRGKSALREILEKEGFSYEE